MIQEKSAPMPSKPDEVELEFTETLRQAAWIFEKEKDGRFKGSIIACQAVARFIYRRDGGAELAGPFLQIAAAFGALEKGLRPKLFSRKTDPDKERARSPERKHIQMIAAAILDVLAKLRDPVPTSADRVARHVNAWPGMQAQEVTGATVIAWRKQLSRSKSKEYRTLVEKTLAESDPRSFVESILRNGPPGLFG